MEIDRSAIRERAKAKGLFTPRVLDAMPDGELFMLLFREQFSTKESISTLSGRGIGLAAVGHALASLNGTVHVESGCSTGTAFTFTLPR